MRGPLLGVTFANHKLSREKLGGVSDSLPVASIIPLMPVLAARIIGVRFSTARKAAIEMC